MPTVDDIQSAVAAVVDLDQDTANVASSDYSLRLEYINNRERRWSEVADWQVLYREYYTQTTTESANATVSLPADFRSLAGFAKAFVGGQQYEFSEIKGQRTGQHSVTDRYLTLIGSPAEGRSVVFHPGTSDGNLASGASIFIPYYGLPTSLASPANSVTCPNPDYLIVGVAADVWEAREDARFQQKQVDAEQILSNMLEKESTHHEGSADDRVRPIEITRNNYRWGK